MKYLILISLVTIAFSSQCDKKICYSVINKCQSNSTNTNQYYDCILKTNRSCFNYMNSSLAQPIRNPKNDISKNEPSTISFNGYYCENQIEHCDECDRCYQTCLDHGYAFWCCFADSNMQNCCCTKDGGLCDENDNCATSICWDC